MNEKIRLMYLGGTAGVLGTLIPFIFIVSIESRIFIMLDMFLIACITIIIMGYLLVIKNED